MTFGEPETDWTLSSAGTGRDQRSPERIEGCAGGARKASWRKGTLDLGSKDEFVE